MFAGPSFGQLLFSTDTLQFARQFARDALFQHLYRPTVGLVNHQWTNIEIVVKLFSCHGKDWQSPWNGSLIMKLCYTWNQEIAAKYIKYIKWYCSQDIATVLHLLFHQLDQSKGSLPIRRKASLDGLKCLPLKSNQLGREKPPLSPLL